MSVSIVYVCVIVCVHVCVCVQANVHERVTECEEEGERSVPCLLFEIRGVMCSSSGSSFLRNNTGLLLNMEIRIKNAKFRKARLQGQVVEKFYT